MEKLITLKNVTKDYDGKNILNNINLDIFKNQLLAGIGPIYL